MKVQSFQTLWETSTQEDLAPEASGRPETRLELLARTHFSSSSATSSSSSSSSSSIGTTSTTTTSTGSTTSTTSILDLPIQPSVSRQALCPSTPSHHHDS